jgi:hypothetical protein
MDLKTDGMTAWTEALMDSYARARLQMPDAEREKGASDSISVQKLPPLGRSIACDECMAEYGLDGWKFRSQRSRRAQLSRHARSF